MQTQLSLFDQIIQIYSESAIPVSNNELYKSLISELNMDKSVLTSKNSVGNNESEHNLFKRKVRWFQQTLKHAGVLKKVEGKRGQWCTVKSKNSDLDKILPHLSVVGFSTKLGVAILGYSETFFSKVNTEITLIITSPPYPLKKARKYGNVSEVEYVDWICKTIEPVIKNLVPGGSLCLNIGNDVFLSGSPARSMYKERLLLALNDRLGLFLMDQLIWHNNSKPPGPVEYASKKRVQLNVAWEPVYWFTNDPSKVMSDNRRVLQPHTDKHLNFVMNGGVKSAVIKSDGAYRLKEGSYSTQTAGRIPKNVLAFGHGCAENRQYRRDAISNGIIPHGATMPIKLASFLIEFLTMPGDLVADPFSGSFTTGKAAENLGRRWIGVDPVVDYVAGAALRFSNSDGFSGSRLWQ